LPNKFWDSLPQLSNAGPVLATRPFATGRRPPVPALTESQKKDALASQLIIDEANEKAARIIAAAQSQADDIFGEAREQGLAQGAEDAREQLTMELTKQFEERRATLQTEVASVLEIIEAQRVALWTNAEKEVLAFAMDVTRKVLKTEVQQNKNAVLEVIRHSLRRVVDKDQLRVRVNPNDVETVRGQRDDLMLVLDGARHLEIIDDRRVEPGGCLIETAAGTIDAKIETQMDQIIQALELEQ